MYGKNECDLRYAAGLLELRAHGIGEDISVLFFLRGEKIGALRLTVEQWQAVCLQSDDILDLITAHITALEGPE